MLPAYVPRVADKLTEGPWKHQLATREKACEDWNSRMASLRSAQPLPFQDYIYYQFRFIHAAHMVGSWGVLADYPLNSMRWRF